jgi:predicted RNase H-like HicB family nuclease
MAVELAGRIELEAPSEEPDAQQSLNAFAIFDGHQWAALCPELDIASVGATGEEALDNLIDAVIEAAAFAHENNLAVGHASPPEEVREFLISSQAPYVGRNFTV